MNFLHTIYNRLSLRTALIVPFLLLILLGVGLTGWLSLQNSQTAINEVTLQLRKEILVRIQEHLNHYLQIPKITNLHTIHALQDGLIGFSQPNNIVQHLSHQLKAYPNVSHIQIGTAKGELLGIEHDQDGFFYLEQANQTTRGNLEIYKINADGEKITDRLPRIVPNYQPQNLGWYQKAVEQKQSVWHIQSGKSQWSNIFNFLGSPWLALSYSTPIFCDDGAVIAVISSDVVLDKVSEFLQSLQIGTSGHTFILERDATLVATSTQDQLFEFDLKTVTTQRFNAQQIDAPLIHASSKYLTQKFNGLDNIRHPQSLDFWLQEQQYFLQVLPYKTDGIDWLIVVVVPAADYLHKIQANKKITLIFMVLTSIVAGLIGILLVSWLTHPLLMLNNAAQKLTAGEWEYEFTHQHRQDELGQLSRAFQHMSSQLKDLFDNLEAKVSERTSELEQASEEIRVLNEYLQADNVRMTAELDVTREFQSMILPRTEELQAIEELDIAGFMEPAEEVGGDYYDVLRYGDTIKIAIGDVTGHGLASGMLMLMVQTAIRTLYVSNMHNPETCLITLNKAIYDNLQRMQSDKNLTLTIIDYQQGKITISGQHEEVLLVRKNGAIECINTLNLGFPIGVIPDIEKLVAYHNLHLEPGDGIVLYTDGITEAMNTEHNLYGIERLLKVVSQHWQQSAQQIQQAIITDVKIHAHNSSYHDDLTLVVMKRVF
jgi:phosphoserine phosphatase RsbU/P